MQEILDLVIGNNYSFSRRIPAIPSGKSVLKAHFYVKEAFDSLTDILHLEITVNSSGVGQIEANGQSDGIAVLRFDLDKATTELFEFSEYYYCIQIETDYIEGIRLIEEGKLTPLEKITQIGPAKITNADRTNIHLSDRVKKLIDVYLDSILNDFRQLRVWDELLRRSANDPKLLMATYRDWNRTFTPQVFDSNNDPIHPDRLIVDYKRGEISIKDDPGYETYFVTYEFNLFTDEHLLPLLELTLQEINASSEPGTHVSDYPDIDSAPPNWDAPLVFGAASKAFRRIASDNAIWKNYLIWQSGEQGSQLASDAASYYQSQFDTMKLGVKRARYIGKATLAYDVFRTIGFGQVSPYSGRFRGLRINRITSY